MARPSNTKERREAIVRALLKVMGRKGFERASVSEVARAAGLASGLVHYHFEDKREILTSLVDFLAAAAEERVRARLDGAGSAPLARIEAFVDAHLALGDDADPQAVACWVEIGAEATRSADVRARYARFLSAQARLLESLVAEALPASRRGEARAIAAALLAAITGCFALAATERSLIPRGSSAATVRRMARGLIGG